MRPSPTAAAGRRWRWRRLAAIAPAWKPRSRSRPATRRRCRRSVERGSRSMASRWQRAAAGVAAAAVTAFAALVAIRVVQQDFVAYWVAGSVRRLGLNPYVNHAVPGVTPTLWDGGVFHHSRFLYPPLAAELFRPLAALPYRVAKVVFTSALVGAWIATAALLARGRRGSTPVLIAGALFFPLYLNLERGQI